MSNVDILSGDHIEKDYGDKEYRAPWNSEDITIPKLKVFVEFKVIILG